MKNLEMITPCNPVLEGLDCPVLKFDDFSAPEADEVVVMSLSGNGLVPGLPIREFSFLGQAQSHEEFQGPIDRGVPDFRMDLGHPGVDLGKVFMTG